MTKVSAPLPRYIRSPEKAPRLLLQERDIAMLEDMWHHRLLTTSQIELLRQSDARLDLRFVSRLTLTRRLKLLFHHQYVQRIVRPMAKGSLEPVYVLDNRAARVLRQRHGDVSVRSPSQMPKTLALDHLLGINQVRVTLTAAIANRKGGPRVELVSWLYNDAVKFSVVVAAPADRSRRVTLIPDAFFSLRVPPQRLFYFVEVDLGSETLKTLVAKCQAYVRYWQSGGFGRDFTVPPQVAFRVLFVAPTQKRARSIESAIRTLEAGRTMFWTTTQAQITPASMLEGIFTDGASGEARAITTT